MKFELVFVLLLTVKKFSVILGDDYNDSDYSDSLHKSQKSDDDELSIRLNGRAVDTLMRSLGSNILNTHPSTYEDGDASTSSTFNSTSQTSAVDISQFTTKEPQIFEIKPSTAIYDLVNVKNQSEVEKNEEEGADVLCGFTKAPDNLTQVEFSLRLTDSCRYDRFVKPPTEDPLNITMQVDIRHIEAMEQLQFKMHMHVQFRYLDHRLNYSTISPKRDFIIGEDKLRDLIWVPHIVLSNERDTSIMGLQGKDVYVAISPLGEVVYSYRMTAQIYCWMDLKKFPFDEQICDVSFRSWIYNASYIILQWEEEDPVMVATQLHLTEYKLTNHWTLSRMDPASFSRGASGNYSNLIFKFQVSREIGFYIMDYFLPSIMLVCTSWVTFWLQADNAAPRITLGTSTMLSFITLASGQSKTLPKVSYIKASEIWFLACTMFIFASIAEFAFVNIIWRRKKKVPVKKVNSKYILKSTFTPKAARRELMKSNSMIDLHKSQSFSSLNGLGKNQRDGQRESGESYNNYLTVHSFHSVNIPTITMQSEDELVSPSKSRRDSYTSVNIDSSEEGNHANSWTTMTPQEIAIWIDRRSRIVFPITFVIFNIFYWSFVYAI